MMREIKFRAWNKNGGWFDYGPLWLNLYGDLYEAPSRTYDTPNIEIEPSDDRYIIMQYTGLKDKNGKEIYEGDIVRWVSTHAMAEQNIHVDAVEWVGAGFMLMPWVHEIEAAEIEIIGNIHENPELLEDTK